MSKTWNLAIVGTTGEVGGQLIESLEERNFPVGKIRYMSDSGVGEVMEFKGKPVVVEMPEVETEGRHKRQTVWLR